MNFDILIVVTKKDFSKFEFLIDSIRRNIPGYDKIHVISDIPLPDESQFPDVNFYRDTIVPFDWSTFRGNIKIRKGWYKQQFIKLFQTVTSDDYLVIDGDVYVNKEVNIIENGKPTFLFGRDQNHKPYFECMKKLCNLGREYNYSFINEIMYFKREYITHLIKSNGWTPDKFFKIVTMIINEANQRSGFAEYELYGNHVTKYYRKHYNYKYIKTFEGGRHRREWSKGEIQKTIDYYKNKEEILLKLHTWV